MKSQLVKRFQLVLVVILSFTPASSETTSSSSSSSSFIRQLQATAGGFEENFSCNLQKDHCNLKGNGQCDNDNASENCVDGDCWDCDLCRQNYNFDCNSCLQQEGCVWCARDARCYNSVFYGVPGASCDHVRLDYSIHSDSTCHSPGDENFFDDPLYSAQRWVFDMINVQDVWERGYRGTGIRVRINDNGVESSHPEFDDRFDVAGSCDHPAPTSTTQQGKNAVEGSHGTSVAAIVGGGAGNDRCSVGVAPAVTLSSCYALNGTGVLAEKLDSFDISQNSFGADGCARTQSQRDMGGGDGDDDGSSSTSSSSLLCPFEHSHEPCEACDFSTRPLSDACEAGIISYCKSSFESDEAACLEFLDLLVQNGQCEFDALSSRDLQDLATGVLEGRDGKGVIYVFAAGNAFVDSNFQGYTNSRLVITVAAVGKDGKHAPYSTTGASTFVSGPGGDSSSYSNHVTAGVNGGCTNAGRGTAFSSPVVSGVVALMLQANPELTWRDVQGILATTSRRVANDRDDDTAQINGAGLWHSNLYGFGIVDAWAAVKAAETWIKYGREKQIVLESGFLDLPLIDKVSSKILIPEQDDEGFVAGAVEVLLDLGHTSSDQLEIVLTSPSGTKSVLTPGGRPDDAALGGDERWKLLTVRNWNESPVGEWTLELLDTKQGDAPTGCVDRPWELPDDGQIITCDRIAAAGWCADGVRNPAGDLDENLAKFLFDSVADDGRTSQDACCACGGGFNADDVTELRQWRLVIYGRSQDGSTSQAPVESPSPPPPGNQDVCTAVGDFLSCPTKSLFSYSGETWTLEVGVQCPIDVVAESSFEAVTEEGLCHCATRVVNPAGEKSDIDCDCSPCPPGGEHPFAYTCASPVVANCRSFSCSGACSTGMGPTPVSDVNPMVPSVTIILETESPESSPTSPGASVRQGPLYGGMALLWLVSSGFWMMF